MKEQASQSLSGVEPELPSGNSGNASFPSENLSVKEDASFPSENLSVNCEAISNKITVR